MTENSWKGRRLSKQKNLSVGHIPAFLVSLKTHNNITFPAISDGRTNRFRTIAGVGIVRVTSNIDFTRVTVELVTHRG